MISDGKVEFRDARDLWGGLDTVETEHAIKREFRDSAVLTIGLPARIRCRMRVLVMRIGGSLGVPGLEPSWVVRA